MEKSQRVIDICRRSKSLQGVAKSTKGERLYIATPTQPIWVPSTEQLLDILFQGEEGWTINSCADLQGFLDVLGAYAHKNNIEDFYELILRFTLSEVFNEDYDI